MNIPLEFPLGSVLRCKHTGFEGRAIGYTAWINGCNRFGLQPTTLDKDGKPQETQWFDEQDVELVAAEKRPVRARAVGGPPIAGDPSR